MPFAFDHSYSRLPERLFARVDPTPVPAPALLGLHASVASLLRVEPEVLRTSDQVACLAGNARFEGSLPIALAYAGHQFGGFVPQLGDGRAILLGEVVGPDGVRRDVQLKGSGRTPFSRGGDGRAALGPVLREHVLSEAMASLGVPTTRSLAALRTGAVVHREQPLPGAVLVRVARSHLRVGTFQYAAAREDRDALRALISHALERHFPGAAQDECPALALLRAVLDAQAKLIAVWMGLGFVHGVMNTDNTSIAGETLDYGPCAFLDAYEPTRTFSSIDRGGRYAFQNQPRIAQWNLARLAEALLPEIHEEESEAVTLATETLETFPARFATEHATVLRRKLGLFEARDEDLALAQDWLDLLARDHVDFTLAFRTLTTRSRGLCPDRTVLGLFRTTEGVEPWLERWDARRASEPHPPSAQAELQRCSNPAFLPRNHQIEAALASAHLGDLGPLERLERVLERPFDDQPDAEDLSLPPDESQWSYRTFCGT